MRLQRSTTSLLSPIGHGDGDGFSPSPRVLHKFQRDSRSSSSPSSSSSRISPAVLVVIVVLAVVFFVSGLLHLIFRFVVKKGRPRPPPPPSASADAQISRHAAELSGPDALQRQLQQLFHLHDSGLDQALIDALPVFFYEDLVGSKEPFDCAVCLCEFDADDELRLLPVCGHAFHLGCIDTWLLSNSTCPLCRGSLFLQGAGPLTENPVFDFGDSREDDAEDETSGERAVPAGAAEEVDPDKIVFPVRLGKFKSLADGNDSGDEGGGVAIAAAIGDVRFEKGETSSSSLDARRCFSMGSYQYVVADANLQVAFKNCSAARSGGGDGRGGGCRGREGRGSCTVNEAAEGKQLGIGGRRESFSVSKIWLWSNKKGKVPVASDATALGANLPWKKKKTEEEAAPKDASNVH